MTAKKRQTMQRIKSFQISKARREKTRREKRLQRKTAINESGVSGKSLPVKIAPSVWGDYAARRMGLD